MPAQRNDQGPSPPLLVVMWVVAGGLGLLGVLAVVELIREGWSWLMFAGALFTFLVATDFGYAAGTRRWPEVWWWFLDW